MYAEVYINTPLLSLDKPFTYRIPKKLLGECAVGARCYVPFGYTNRLSEGIITNITEEVSFENIKEIKSVIDPMPLLSKKDIDLIFKMREDYYCTFYAAAKLFLPAGSEQKKEEWVNLTDKFTFEEACSLVKRSALQERLLMLLNNAGGSMEMTAIRAEMGKGARGQVNALIKKGIATLEFKSIKKVSEKTVKVAYYSCDEDAYLLAEKMRKKSPVQAKIIEFLANGGKYTISDIMAECEASRNSIEALNIKGIIEFEEKRILRSPVEDKEERSLAFEATDEQKTAIEKIKNAKRGTFLIHGVTGSGKTEVYLQLVEDVIRMGKQAIVLVPEISLTPQITDRFYKRFGSVVAIMHSALSLGERYDEYSRIRKGEAKVVVGARSAIFAPVRDLGIIIVDEEHEYSYKSETTPKYHAIEVARMRAESFDCPLVLASATPSAESYYKAECGEYTLIELTKRYNLNPLPKVEIVDMRKELEEGNRTVLSRSLAKGMYENLRNGEQTILFLNRRGFSTFVSCRDCGFVYMCPNCSVSLTYHASNDTLNCHICSHRQGRDALCPECGSRKIKDFGAGTQKAERQIAEIFPTAKVVRMDADTTGGKNGHEKVLSEFEKDESDILLGTQMVSKGLDFPRVTLVGALAADASLFSDDFRAQERTFALICQVSGRAGRGDKEGRAVIQTYAPENRVLQLAAKQDYKAFYRDEIAFRKAFGYPPFEHIVNILITGEDEEKCEKCAALVLAELKVAEGVRSEGAILYGPHDAPIKKIQGRYRKRIWFKIKDSKALGKDFRKMLGAKRPEGIQITVDIDPYSMS
ncbi:MAG: primosomal protein N' [Clostridia bacterium]|nr:primosomal protein N' [Clostridia bacterium]